MAEDTVRVLRVLEYVGPRDAVEEQIKMSLHGERQGILGKISKKPCIIRAATIGLVPDIIEMGKVENLLPPV